MPSIQQFFSYPPHIFVEHTDVPPVVHNDHVFTEFIQGEDRCLKFIGQDLNFLQSSTIPPTVKIISITDSTSAKVRESHTQIALLSIQLPTHTPQEHSASPLTQTTKPGLGFTSTEICRAQSKPKLTVEQLLEIESCQEYIKTPLQTLDGMYVNQCKRFLLLAKKVKKLAEALKMEQDATQWAGILLEKLIQESFIEQLNSILGLEQLALLHTAQEHLPQDIINILDHLGKVNNILFNQLYNLAEDCVDRY